MKQHKRLLAEMRVYPHNRNGDFAKRCRRDIRGVFWCRVYVDRRGEQSCDCGCVLPQLVPLSAACVHITRLHNRRGITDDARKATTDAWIDGLALVRLTERGKALFYPLWAAETLKQMNAAADVK